MYSTFESGPEHRKFLIVVPVGSVRTRVENHSGLAVQIILFFFTFPPVFKNNSKEETKK